MRRRATRSGWWPAFALGTLFGVALLWVLLALRPTLWPWMPAPGADTARVELPKGIGGAGVDPRGQDNRGIPVLLPPAASVRPPPGMDEAMPLPDPDPLPVEPADGVSTSDSARRAAASPALLIPVAGVRADQLRDTFAEPRGQGRSHEGIDILAPTGTPVLAVDDGSIARLFDSKPGGLTIYQFDPDTRYAYYYAHLDRYAEGLREGQRVSRGEVIGHVGSSGNASPAVPHLHFAIFQLGPEKNWWRGTAINPYTPLGGG